LLNLLCMMLINALFCCGWPLVKLFATIWLLLHGCSFFICPCYLFNSLWLLMLTYVTLGPLIGSFSWPLVCRFLATDILSTILIRIFDKFPNRLLRHMVWSF
jgi:hypothetical protein